MKTTKWFKTGEPVPKDAVYIKTENKVVGREFNDDPMGGSHSNVHEEFHLYEIQLEDNDPKHGPFSDIWSPRND